MYDAELWGGSRFQIPCLEDWNRTENIQKNSVLVKVFKFPEFQFQFLCFTTTYPNLSHAVCDERVFTGFTVRAVGNPIPSQQPPAPACVRGLQQLL